MAISEQLARLEVWNRWKRSGDIVDLHAADLAGARLPGVNLSGARLRRVDLSKADLSEADLSQTYLRKADLRAANLYKANLAGADLSEANLTGADFHWANLSGAKFEDANLAHANLYGTDVTHADFRFARLLRTAFSDMNLARAKGLADCIHQSPSCVGIDTIFKSNGEIPEVFLRGCGLPEQFIIYSRSLVGQPIQFYSCFISYSSYDQVFADYLYADLQNKGVRCWFAPHEVRGGRKLHEQIDEAIRMYDRLLLILSEHSMNSEWVKTEIANARQKELNEQRQALFPISLVPFGEIREWKNFDADTGKDSAREVREYFIPDFSNWKDHDVYAKTFERLLRDMSEVTGEASAKTAE